MDLFQLLRRGAGSKDLGDGRGFGGCEVGAEEREAGSEVPRRRHPCSLARSAAVETETLGCGWEEIGGEEAGEVVLRSARKKREATLCPRGVGGSGQQGQTTSPQPSGPAQRAVS
jgi:hypothetical protein